MKLTESYLRNLIKEVLNENKTHLNGEHYDPNAPPPKTPYKKMIDSAAKGDSRKAGKLGSYLQSLLDKKPKISDEEIKSLLQKKIDSYVD